jgi:glycerate dehydrogenase
MRVLATDIALAPGLVDLPAVLRSSDVVTLHAPLTDDTRNLIGAEQLAMMRRNAILINTARGGLVDEGALAQALQDGIIGGAGFDVLTNEPPRAGNVLLDLNLPNFIVTPHIMGQPGSHADSGGSADRQYRSFRGRRAAQHCVSPSVVVID